MTREHWHQTGRILAAVVILLGWPPTLLALGYFTAMLTSELSSRCNPVSNPLGLWVPIALLSMTLFCLTIIRIGVGHSPWRFIDHIRTLLLTTTLIWVGGIGVFMVYATDATRWHTLGGVEILLATPALIPLAQTVGALAAVRYTKNWAPMKRVALLFAITLGLPTLWITAVETLASIICR